MSGVEHAHGAAWRRRQRRLRQHWRHEQLTLQMVLATVEHHSHGAPRSLTTATRTRVEERELHTAPRRQEPPQPAGTQFFTMLDEDSDVPELGGGRPVSMTEPRGPQERVLQRTMEPGPDLLVVPVLQMVDQLAEVVVDVPNIVSQSEFQLRTVEQFVNIPIPDSGISGFGLHGFLPGQSSSATVEQIADISVPRRVSGTAEGLQGFLPGQSTAASSEQIVDIQVAGGGLQGFYPKTGFNGVLPRFPSCRSWWKSSKLCPRTEFYSVLWNRT